MTALPQKDEIVIIWMNIHVYLDKFVYLVILHIRNDVHGFLFLKNKNHRGHI